MAWDHDTSEKRQALQMTRVPGKFGVGPGWFLNVPREAKWLLSDFSIEVTLWQFNIAEHITHFNTSYSLSYIYSQ